MKTRNSLAMAFSLALLCTVQGVLFAASDPKLLTRVSALSEETILGPGDSVTLATPEIEELDKRVLVVDAGGAVDVPLVGLIEVSGSTPQAFAEQVRAALRRLYLKPQVAIASVDVKSRPISVFGSVNTPGVQQADGRKRLMEVLSLAGGLRQDAGPRIELTRQVAMGVLPAGLGAKSDERFQTADISVSDLLEARRPEDNVVIRAGDVITVPKARLIYVIGDVKKAGGFVVGEHDNLTVLKALALAEGLQSTADAAHAKIVRADGATDGQDGRPLNIKKLLAGQEHDTLLHPDDVLFVPSSLPKKAALRIMEAAIQTGTGIAIWH